MSKNKTLNEEVDYFVLKWDEFAIDYWWRKRYNIPFGSSQHREMNFIDMAVEYREQINFMRATNERDEPIRSEEDERVVRMTEEEIDEDYENLDLSKF